jgi:hypothetical protein
MTPEELRTWVRDSRARQGLGPTITDPAAQEQFAAMAADALTRQNGDGADHANDKRPAAETPTARARARRKAAS